MLNRDVFSIIIRYLDLLILKNFSLASRKIYHMDFIKKRLYRQIHRLRIKLLNREYHRIFYAYEEERDNKIFFRAIIINEIPFYYDSEIYLFNYRNMRYANIYFPSAPPFFEKFLYTKFINGKRVPSHRRLETRKPLPKNYTII